MLPAAQPRGRSAAAGAHSRRAGGHPATICGQPIPPPRALPPAGSGPVVYLIAPCFEAQGNISLVDYQTYLYYIQLKASRPSRASGCPYDEDVEQDDPRGLQAAVGHQLPRQPLD